jgi:hypothetical protein
MDELRFEWNPQKAESNKRKHRVSFELAKQAFRDPHLKIELEGYDHGEERWRAVGQVGHTLLLVSCTIREEGGIEVVRIISARKAEPQERHGYEGDT